MSAGQKNRPRVLLRVLLFVAAGAMIVYGAVRLGGYLIELHASRSTAQELREIYAQEAVRRRPPVGTRGRSLILRTR